MKIKNITYSDYDNYLNGLIKSLSNFCNKCPLKPTIKVVKELGKIYVSYKDNDIEILINVNENKKLVISDLKKMIEKEYPIIYKKTLRVPDADEVKRILAQGKSLEEALNSTQVVYDAVYRIERVHDKYNEMDLLSLNDGEIYKFKCKIPLIAVLEDLKYNGKDSDAIDHLNFLYKINSEK